MVTSLFLAKLLGPLFVVLALSTFIYAKEWRDLIGDAVKNKLVIFVSGMIALLFGLLIVLNHNVWVWQWYLLITLVGWCLVLKGLCRLLLPKVVVKCFDFLNKGWVMTVCGIIVIVIGLVFSYYGYWV